MIAERIGRYLEDPQSEEFDSLALDAFAFQYETIPPVRRLCDRRGLQPQTIRRWQEIPLVPTTAFKTLELCAAPPQETFRSSGTTDPERRSTHYHPFPDLYRRVIDASFPRFCLAGLAQPPMLSLIPSREQLPDSSLAFMVDHILERYGSADSLIAFGRRGVEVSQARSWLASRQRAGHPCLILATPLALLQLLDGLDRPDLRFRLPPGSVLFETGGLKSRTREVSRRELLRRLADRLGLPPTAVVREYGMTELTSQAYTQALAGGDADLFVTPHWMQVRLLEPESLEDAPAGQTGLIAVLDLANIGSAVHLLTEDLGSREEGEEGFRLVGRAAGAELRGCSLVVEELREDSSNPAPQRTS